MKNIFKFITRFEEFVLSYSILLMAFILIGSVLSRTFLNSSWTFAEEVGQSLTIIVTFMGVGYCAKKANHITMSAVFDLLNPKFKKIFMIIISGVSTIMMLYIAYISFQYTMKVLELGRVTPSLRIPMYLIIAIVPIGFILGAIEYARTFILNVTRKQLYLSTEVVLDTDLKIIPPSDAKA